MINNTNNDNFDSLLIEFIELIDYTLSNRFIEKWRFKYSEKFVKHFQVRLLKAMRTNRTLKLSTLFTYLHKKCKYSPDQVINFFESIEIDLYQPLITGDILQLTKDL